VFWRVKRYVSKHRKQKKYIQNLEAQIGGLKKYETVIEGQTVEDKMDGIQFTVNPQYADWRDRYKQEKMRELMEQIAKSKLTQQKMLIEKDQLKRDVSDYQNDLADYERKIEALEDEFDVDYAPDENLDDGFAMPNEKSKLKNDDESEINFDDEDDASSVEDMSEESSDNRDRKAQKKALMEELGQEGMISSDEAEKSVKESEEDTESESEGEFGTSEDSA